MEESMNNIENVLEKAFDGLTSALPAAFSRSAVPTLLGGAISAGTLANPGKAGQPPFLLNGHVDYTFNSCVITYQPSVHRTPH